MTAKKNKVFWGVIAIVVIVAVAVTALCVDWAALTTKASTPAPSATPAPTTGTATNGTTTNTTSQSWLHYYNLDLQNDDNPDNDFNFGYSPIGADGLEPAAEYDVEFRNRLKKDPALAAATMAWHDATFGTRFLGNYYEEHKDDPVAAINAASRDFAKSQQTYYKGLDALFAFMDKHSMLELRECNNVEDQMYMNPCTADGIPDVVVFKTLDHTGYELVYGYNIKDNLVEIAFRINCGFQPTNVANTLGIIVPEKEKKPDPTPTPPPPGPDPTPVPTPTPTPTPTPPPYEKDPDKAPDINTEPNDDPGPGPNTINPDDPYHSMEDEPTNSTNMFEDYDDYRDWMDELEDINQTQKVGGDDNTPTVTPAPNTKVDSNADNGTGYGGIDKPTPTQPPATEANTGKPISEKPGVPWGGPPD